MVYEVSNEQTFLNIRNWLTSIEDTVSKPIPLLLIANKCDRRYLNDNNGQFNFISRQLGQRLADEIGPNCIFIETSCKTGFNIDNIMIIAIKMIIAEQNRKNHRKINDGLKVTNKLNSSKKCC
ncbi:hypothetical protein BLA29_002118 [Euroglyphus maynei]|uniref:Uncharacterized protein n=1 Tax=Euroglyphus maynei TaxID=6958 RepID=A0A1Y3BTW4_EURMA|nr:hypothetical protein BLA29_002118 [Euroglyphus maynei]